MSDRHWEKHYTRVRSRLLYPDENLVRLVLRDLSKGEVNHSLPAVDLGCGSGRHLKLLRENGITSAVGTDYSYNALSLARELSPLLVQADNRRLPLKSGAAGLVIAWGSLHYGSKKGMREMVEEIFRLLHSGGKLYATLRCSRDTCLRKGKHVGNDTWITDLEDIAGSTVSFYREEELPGLFDRFATFNYGIIERSLVGDAASVISHWVIRAGK